MSFSSLSARGHACWIESTLVRCCSQSISRCHVCSAQASLHYIYIDRLIKLLLASNSTLAIARAPGQLPGDRPADTRDRLIDRRVRRRDDGEQSQSNVLHRVRWRQPLFPSLLYPSYTTTVTKIEWNLSNTMNGEFSTKFIVLS